MWGSSLHNQYLSVRKYLFSAYYSGLFCPIIITLCFTVPLALRTRCTRQKVMWDCSVGITRHIKTQLPCYLHDWLTAVSRYIVNQKSPHCYGVERFTSASHPCKMIGNRAWSGSTVLPQRAAPCWGRDMGRRCFSAKCNTYGKRVCIVFSHKHADVSRDISMESGKIKSNLLTVVLTIKNN